MEVNLLREYDKIQQRIQDLKNKIMYSDKVINSLYDMTYLENHRLIIQEENKYQQKYLEEIDRLQKVLTCKHEWNSLGKGLLLDNKNIEVLRCNKCGISKQLAPNGRFALGWWNDRRKPIN